MNVWHTLRAQRGVTAKVAYGLGLLIGLVLLGATAWLIGAVLWWLIRAAWRLLSAAGTLYTWP